MSRPYDTTTRTAAADRKRGDIVVAARALLREGSAEGFSLDAVAKRAGVTRVTVYNQFGSRNGLLEAVFDAAAIDAGIGRIPQAMTAPDLKSALDLLVCIFCDLWTADPALGEVIRAATTDTELARLLAERNNRRRQMIGILIGRHGGVAEPDQLAALALMLTAHASWAAVQAETGDAEKTKGALRAAMRALLAAAGHDTSDH